MSTNNLQIKLRTVDDKIKFAATARENPQVMIDYFKPAGTEEGYTPVELLMVSFASCVSMVLLGLLRSKMGKTVSGLEASATGLARQEHPKSLSHIRLELTIDSSDATDEDVEKALAVSEEKLCPVWAMIKGNTQVDVAFVIQKAQQG